MIMGAVSLLKVQITGNCLEGCTQKGKNGRLLLEYPDRSAAFVALKSNLI